MNDPAKIHVGETYPSSVTTFFLLTAPYLALYLFFKWPLEYAVVKQLLQSGGQVPSLCVTLIKENNLAGRELGSRLKAKCDHASQESVEL